jgi:DNA-directed RNA polymerase subunit F
MESEYEVLKEEPVPLVKAKELLKDVEEKTFEQKIAFEHAKKFSKITLQKAGELQKELSTLEMRKLKDEQIIKIIDMMPADVDELRVILAHAQVPYRDEELQQISDIVKKYEK